jgi:hypothetical protein
MACQLSKSSPEWLSQIGWLLNNKPQPFSEASYTPTARDIAYAAKRDKLVTWMEDHGGMITANEARAVYGSRHSGIYKAMDMLVEEGRVELCGGHPKTWRLK